MAGIIVKSVGSESVAPVGQGDRVVVPEFFDGEFVDKDLVNLQALYDGGEAGALYAPWVRSSLYEDSAGTTLASLDGPVGRMEDLSGNGNHAIQSTADSRPVLRYSGGLYYLEFDGVDDYLGSTAASLRITGDLTLLSGVFKVSEGSFFPMLSCQTNASNINQYEHRGNAETTADVTQIFIAADGAVLEKDGGDQAVLGQATQSVAHARRNSGASVDIGIDDASRSQKQTFAHTMIPTSDANSEFRIGSRKGSSLYANGRFYAAMVVDRQLTDAELLSARRAAANRTGFTLV